MKRFEISDGSAAIVLILKRVCLVEQMALSRQVSVSDLPPEVTKEYLELLFENPTRCPDGGDVESVEVDENSRTAVVTLEDERGRSMCRWIQWRIGTGGLLNRVP